MSVESPYPNLRWEIFCRVVDNFGDIGVCWRLASNLARRGQTVRLWVDDPSALSWMAPKGWGDVEVRHWASPFNLANTLLGDVLVEAFGCDINPEFIAAYANSIRDRGQECLWINLEYLSAEGFAERCHGLPSPVMSGPGAGLTKHFYYPGFTPNTGGLLREPDLQAQQRQFDRKSWLERHGVGDPSHRVISLFCYEPSSLDELLDSLATNGQASYLLVTHGRANVAVQVEISRKNALNPLWNERQTLSFVYLPALSQADFDRLLWSCDLNFVRGEDSLVRAIWAGQPFVWQIYPQGDGAHQVKLNAFLDWLQAPQSLRQVHSEWNHCPVNDQAAPHLGLETSSKAAQESLTSCFDLNTPQLTCWRTCALAARDRIASQPDLTTQLLGFATKKH